MKVRSKDAGLAAKAQNVGDVSDSHSDGVMCLMCKAPDTTVALASRATWIVDSGATAHICVITVTCLVA